MRPLLSEGQRPLVAAGFWAVLNSAHTAQVPPLVGVQQITAGFGHTCALLTSGTLDCWGSNSSGQLGNGGSTPDSGSPLAVSSLSGDASAAAAGYYHTCALTTAGEVKCWGGNTYGQLGNNSMGLGSTVPITVVTSNNAAITGITAVGTGGLHTCALTIPPGGVSCWGWNYYGQLGNNSATITSSATPVTVVDGGNTPLTGIAAIALGGLSYLRTDHRTDREVLGQQLSGPTW